MIRQMRYPIKSYIILLLVFAAACGKPGFKNTANGLQYMIIEGDERGRKVQMNEIITLDLKYATDSIEIFNSENLQFPVQIKISEPSFYGDVMEGFLMMNVGDSGIFKASADTFYKYVGQEGRPAEVVDGDMITFEVKITNTQTQEELTAAKRSEELIMMEKEREMIDTYIMENDVKAEPSSSGLYFIERAAGTGDTALRGHKVRVHAIVRSIQGKEIESTYKSDNPLDFILGSGQINLLGLDEGVGMMSEGGRATLILPSALAFGSKPPPGSKVGPYTPLVIDVELVKILNK